MILKKDFGDLQSRKSEKTPKEKASGSEIILLKSLCFCKKKLFVESKRGKLNVPKEELENHLTYSDDLNCIPRTPLRDLPKSQDPTVMFVNGRRKLKEVRDFVHKPRAGSSRSLMGHRRSYIKTALVFSGNSVSSFTGLEEGCCTTGMVSG